jgi:hypothetical protein
MPDFGSARREAGNPWNAAGIDRVWQHQEQAFSSGSGIRCSSI